MPIYGMAPGGATINYTAYDYNGNQLTFDASPVPPPPPVNTRARSHNVWGDENEAGTNTHTDAVALAQGNAYDIIAVQLAPGNVSQYTAAQITAMKAANPNLKILVYRNAGEAVPADPTGTFPESYFAHDATGARCFNSTWNTYPMQPDSGWGPWMITSGQARSSVVDTTGTTVNYDGQFDDVLGDSPIGDNPVNPTTGAAYTNAQWYAMTRVLGAQIKTANPGKLIIANGLASGDKYFSNSRVLLTVSGAVDGGVAESFVRTSGQATDSVTGSSWTNCLRMIQDIGSLGKIAVCMTKDWTTAVDSLKDARLQYAFATFLLVDDGTHYFCGSKQKGVHTMDILPWLSNTDYGTALGPYTIDANGCYYRSFTKSSIGVNPTSVAHSMTVGGQTTTVQPHRAVFVLP